MRDARPEAVSDRARARMRDEVGTLGSGNHYLEVQEVAEVHDAAAAEAFGLRLGDVVVSIHCGSRGFGHQIGTEALREMLDAGRRHGIDLPDRELACAPDPLEGGRALPRRDARRHQRGPRQPPGPHPPHARGGRLRAPAVGPHAPLRRLAQHLQGGDARGGREAARGLRPPQGRDAGVGAGAPGAARPPAPRRPAGAHRRHDGHVELGAGRHRERHARELRLRLPRRGPRA